MQQSSHFNELNKSNWDPRNQMLHDLKRTGAFNAYCQMLDKGLFVTSLNFLYALVGAVEDKHWKEVGQEQKAELLMMLEARKEHLRQFD